jgi:hypothetical protein
MHKHNSARYAVLEWKTVSKGNRRKSTKVLVQKLNDKIRIAVEITQASPESIHGGRVFRDRQSEYESKQNAGAGASNETRERLYPD